MGAAGKNGASVVALGDAGTVLVTSGQPEPRAVLPSEPPAQLSIGDIDVEAEYIEITNPTGKAVDMTGWGVVSDKGNQFYPFPDGFRLGSGKSVRVYSGISKEKVPAGSLYWSDRKMWRDKKQDEASLLDPYAKIIARK